MSAFISETLFDIVSGKLKGQILIRIEHPVCIENEWVCKVSFRGMVNEKVAVKGVDSLQALSIALKIVEYNLKSFDSVYIHGEQNPFQFEAYFPTD